MRDKQNRLVLVPYFPCRKRRLIDVDELDLIEPGDIAMIDDDKLIPVDRRIEMDVLDPPVRNMASHRSPVPHARNGHVVNIGRPPRELVDPIDPQNVGADHHHNFEVYRADR